METSDACLCPNCQMHAVRGQQFCGHCGAPLPFPKFVADFHDYSEGSEALQAHHGTYLDHAAQKSYGHKFCIICGKEI